MTSQDNADTKTINTSELSNLAVSTLTKGNSKGLNSTSTQQLFYTYMYVYIYIETERSPEALVEGICKHHKFDP